jgi:hypothetical protein
MLNEKIKYMIGLIVLCSVVFVSCGDDEESNVVEEKKTYKVNSFYENATKIDQAGSTIIIEFAVKEANKSGFDTDPAEGTLKAKFRWTGAGVPSGKEEKAEIEITEDMYTCTVFCKAKVSVEVPKAYTKASWRNTVLTFTSKDTKKSFSTSVKDMQLGN